MAIRIFAILFSTLFLARSRMRKEGMRERSDWRKFFSEFQAKGTIVVADERQTDRVILVFDQVRSEKRYSPASTFRFHIHFLHLTQALHVMSFKFSDGTASKRSFTSSQPRPRLAISNAEFYCLDLPAVQKRSVKTRLDAI